LSEKKRKITSSFLYVDDLEFVDVLVDEGRFESRSDFMRKVLGDYLEKEREKRNSDVKLSRKMPLFKVVGKGAII